MFSSTLTLFISFCCCFEFCNGLKSLQWYDYFRDKMLPLNLLSFYGSYNVIFCVSSLTHFFSFFQTRSLFVCLSKNMSLVVTCCEHKSYCGFLIYVFFVTSYMGFNLIFIYWKFYCVLLSHRREICATNGNRSS